MPFSLRTHIIKYVMTDNARTKLPVEFGQVTLPFIESIKQWFKWNAQILVKSCFLGTKTRRRLIRNYLHLLHFGVIWVLFERTCFYKQCRISRHDHWTPKPCCYNGLLAKNWILDLLLFFSFKVHQDMIFKEIKELKQPVTHSWEILHVLTVFLYNEPLISTYQI